MPAPKKARKIAVGKSTDATPSDVATAAAASSEKPAGKRVLLVDDDTEIVESMRTVLD